MGSPDTSTGEHTLSLVEAQEEKARRRMGRVYRSGRGGVLSFRAAILRFSFLEIVVSQLEAA
jgi:hypothetical protein